MLGSPLPAHAASLDAHLELLLEPLQLVEKLLVETHIELFLEALLLLRELLLNTHLELLLEALQLLEKLSSRDIPRAPTGGSHPSQRAPSGHTP